MKKRASKSTDPVLTVFVPCFNEEGSLTAGLDTIMESLNGLKFSYEILLVDDASTDRSLAVMEEYVDKHPDAGIRIIANEANKGFARNLIDAAFMGRGEFFRSIPAWNADPVESLRDVFKLMRQADMIIPYIQRDDRDLKRRFLSSLYTYLVTGITGHSLRYYNGNVLYRREHVMRWHTPCEGSGIRAELLSRVLDEGFSYIEVPANVNMRTAGKTESLKLRNFLSVAYTLLQLSIRRLARRKQRLRGAGKAI